MRGRKLWLRAETQSGPLSVYVVKELRNESGDPLHAEYDPDTHTILVEWCENATKMKQDLHHELLHVCFAGSSGDARENALGPDYVTREEKLVSFLEPVHFDLLMRNGWLKYPNPPRPK